MKNRLISITAIALLSIIFMGQAQAIDETTVDLTISPGEKDGAYLPVLESDTIDVKVTSDVPVDVYIVTYSNIEDAILSDDFEYEKKWSDQTSLNVNYVVEDQEELYYILIHNTDGSEIANVELEYKLYQEIAGEIVEDAVEDACCGSTVLLGIAGLFVLLTLALFVKSKKN